MAAQILLAEGFTDLDPSHPLGGKDGGKDAICARDDIRWAMAAYFPRGQQEFRSIQTKFMADVTGATTNGAQGIAFVTNQELKLGERKDLTEKAGDLRAEIYHLERITSILDRPFMASVRRKFLKIGEPVSSFPSFVDKWVSVEYVEKGGIARSFEAQGYRVAWTGANLENERIDFEGWEYVEIEQPDGALARLRVKEPEPSIIGGNLVFLKNKVF